MHCCGNNSPGGTAERWRSERWRTDGWWTNKTWEWRVMPDIRSHQSSHRHSEWSYQHFLFGSHSLNHSDLNVVAGVGESILLQPVHNFQPLLRHFQPSVWHQRQILRLTCRESFRPLNRPHEQQRHNRMKRKSEECKEMYGSSNLLFRTQEVAEKCRFQIDTDG